MSTPCTKTATPTNAWVFRYDVESSDSKMVGELVAATEKFYDDEIALAVELVEERLARGPASGYEFIFAQHSAANPEGVVNSDSASPKQFLQLPPTANPECVIGSSVSADNIGRPTTANLVGASVAPGVIGFACYGKIPCTRAAYDLYWIAVHPHHQGCGLGSQLLTAVEQAIRKAGGTQLYADTSGRPDYEATRRYYLSTGFEQAACLTDFYAPGDDKIIFRKSV